MLIVQHSMTKENWRIACLPTPNIFNTQSMLGKVFPLVLNRYMRFNHRGRDTIYQVRDLGPKERPKGKYNFFQTSLMQQNGVSSAKVLYELIYSMYLTKRDPDTV